MKTRVTALGEATTLADRKRRAGQRLVIGFEGPAVDAELRALVREIGPAGFVLFARNVAEPSQVRELNRELASLVDPHFPALLSVDQEGGRVQRIRDPATVWPPMRILGRVPEQVEATATAIARELSAMGFNLNFAPVADVDSNPKNPIIGDRSFHHDPERVADHVERFVRAHQAEGVIACAKHFPGHGDTTTDSHLTLPVVEKDEPDLRAVELVPFRRAVHAGVGSMMTSHVVYPAWDEEWPATLSERIGRGLLREDLGYRGVLFSDDLEMKAMAGRYTVAEQVRRATRSSVDILLCCKTAALQHEAYRELVHIQEEDAGLERDSIDAVARISALREAFLVDRRAPPDLGVIGCAQHRDLSEQLRARGA